MGSFAVAVSLSIAALLVTVMTNSHAQIIIDSKGLCLANNTNKTCEDFNYFVDDCYCDLNCIQFEDCCSDFYQLDYCNDNSSTECASGSVRLVGGGTLDGFVEVCIFRKWYPVCNETFDENAAVVTCQFLGYNATEDSLNYATPLPVQPFPGSFYPSCQSGMEPQLTDCLIQQHNDKNCSQQAIVNCFSHGISTTFAPKVGYCNIDNCVNGLCISGVCDCHGGWNGTQCADPVCSPACINGECIEPFTCSCQSGWTGLHCGLEIDECLSGLCQHNCTDGLNSYTCSCQDGFFLAANGHSCYEIVKCSSGPCEHNCTDGLNHYTCSCQDGFILLADGHSCYGQCTNASTCMSTNALAVPLAAVLCTVLSSVISSVVTGFITCYCFMKRSKKEGYEHHNQRPSQIEPEYENPFLFRKNLANIELKQNTCYATQADVQAI